MATVEERIYELGSGTLADKERQVAEIRGRGATLLAAGAVIASLLARPAFHGGHPHGATEVVLAAIGLLGCGGVLVFVLLLLRPYQMGFSVRAGVIYRRLRDQDSLEQPMVDFVLAEAFEERRADNAEIVMRLGWFLALALTSLLLETVGLAAAAALGS